MIHQEMSDCCQTVGGGAGGKGRCGGWAQDRSAAGTAMRQAGSLCPGCLQRREKFHFTWLRGRLKTNWVLIRAKGFFRGVVAHLLM